MTDERTTAYFLKELSTREAQEFEEQCFAQPEWPQADLEAAEDALIEAYIKNELSRQRQRRFEKYYLTTAVRRERVLLAQSFHQLACPGMSAPPRELTLTEKIRNFLNPQSESQWVHAAKFAGVILAAALVVALVMFPPRTRAPQTFADINLATSSDTRGLGDARNSSSPVKVSLPLAKDALRIALTLPGPAPAGTTYRVQWEDINGPVDELKIQKQDVNSLTVIIPAEKLKPGQHLLRLSRKNPDGTEHATGNYFFDAK